ncbi:MAG: ATP synthase F1 subunit gamma [Anaerolineaceae bacterium]
MPSAREMRLRLRSIKSIAQVTRALQTVSASKVRKAIQAVNATRPYAEKAWHLLVHLANQPGHAALHPLLRERDEVKHVTVVMISSDRGLAGAYNMNVLRYTLNTFHDVQVPVEYVAVGRKGRDLLLRRGKKLAADFSNLPANPTFSDVSAIGRLVVDDYLNGKTDAVYLAYTDFHNMIKQTPTIKKLLPLEVKSGEVRVQDYNEPVKEYKKQGVYIYEPDQKELLDQVISRFTALQVYQAILESSASEQAARMVAMRNATDNANELRSLLLLEYNKIRQQSITNEMLDISAGAEALANVQAGRD